MSPTRRDVLKGAGVIAGTQAFPIVFRSGKAWAEIPPDAALRRRLVVVYLAGGNDGLNTVVPVGNVTGGARRTVYDQFRPVVNIPIADTLAFDRTPDDAAHGVALNKRLATVHQFYRDGRLAVVQGADYPGHSYSHFDSRDYWESGQPQENVRSGWLGRHLDRVGIADGELRAVAVARELPLMFQGEPSVGRVNSAVAFDSIGSVRFVDGLDSDPEFASRHNNYATYSTYPDASDPMRAFYGDRCKQTADLVRSVSTLPVPPNSGLYFANLMLNARAMLTANLGVECVNVIHYSGYDTHDNQVVQHDRLMNELDQGIEAFYFGTRAGTPITGAGVIDPDLASRTLLVVFSEFGRTIGDNGRGTDHGGAAPMFLIGPPAPAPGSGVPMLTPGLHGEHPNMGTQTLPNDDLSMTTDVRRVYQAVLQSWLADQDDHYVDIGVTPLTGLFGTA